MRYSSYELKYCERCGGLGLRRSQSGSPYCYDCEQMLTAFLPSLPAAPRRGQLRRIVHRLHQRMLAKPAGTRAMQEAAHAS